jgi:hypothetical protein
MKKICTLFLIVFISNIHSQTSTSFWYEGFNSGPCSKGVSANNCVATATNGAWAITSFSLPYMNGPYANEWYISAEEQGQAVNVCGGVTCGGFNNKTLHMSSYVPAPPPPIIDIGTDYESGPGNNTNKRAETPTLNFTGYSNVQMSFKTIYGGVPTLDYCDLEYFDGTSWNVLTTMAVPNSSMCPTIGTWTFQAYGLPPSLSNNPNVKIGWHWYNSDPTGGDFSVGMDDIEFSVSTIVTNTVVDCINASSTASLGNIAIGNSSFTWAAVPNSVTLTTTSGTTTAIQYPGVGTYTLLCYGSYSPGVATSTAMSIVNVVFGSTPTVSAMSSASLLCNGGSAVLTASGSTSYTWSTSSNSPSITVSPTVNTTYTVTGKTGYCVSTTTIQQMTDPCTGINELNASEFSSVFPNPFSHELFFKVNGETEIKLINIKGETVKEMKVRSDSRINTVDLPKGIYFLNIRNSQGERNLKLVKE